MTLIDWKRPSAYNISKWYKDIITSIWGDQGIATLLLPTYSVDYNFNMSGVDQHDQMRSYSPTQLISVRNWLPFFSFYWMRLSLMHLWLHEKFSKIPKYLILLGNGSSE